MLRNAPKSDAPLAKISRRALRLESARVHSDINMSPALQHLVHGEIQQQARRARLVMRWMLG
ncbi:Unknown protein sequence [Pseudomonas savastanoi pv. phaseolicola]|nr:Unknown protein sequence [Pseudomonas savastanoi pv. phaseolicola]